VQSKHRHPPNQRLELCISKSWREGIYPLTTIEIAQAQHKDRELKVYYKKNARMPKEDMCFQFIENTKVLCKKANL
jgi:hypothetical protein